MMYICKTETETFLLQNICRMNLLMPLLTTPVVLQEANKYRTILVVKTNPVIVTGQVSKGNILQITRKA